MSGAIVGTILHGTIHTECRSFGACPCPRAIVQRGRPLGRPLEIDAISGRMAEVAKTAEALVDSVIKAAEDAVSQARQGAPEGQGASQVRPQTMDRL